LFVHGKKEKPHPSGVEALSYGLKMRKIGITYSNT